MSKNILFLSSSRYLASALITSTATLAILASSANAASLSWTSTGNSTLGGTGTWDTSSSLWWNGSSAQAWSTNTTSGDTAVFAGTAGTVTAGANINALGLTFSTTGYTVALGGNTLALGSGGINASALTSGTTTISGGTLNIASGYQSWTAGAGATLNVGSTVTRTAGAAVNFSTTGTINTTGSGLANTNGILGGWATVGNAGTTGANGDWAALDGSNNIVAYSGYTNITGSMGAADYSTQNWKVTNAVGALTASATVNSLVLTTDFSISSGATMTLGSGGLILSGNSRWLKNNGNGNTSGTGQLTSGLASGELFIDSSGSGGASDNDWRIWTKIVDNGGTAVTLVKTGPGYLRLENTNTYTGGTILNSGTLFLSNNGAAGGSGQLGTGTVTLNGGTLNLNAATLGNNVVVPTGASATIDNASNNGTLGGNFTGGGTLTIQNTSSANLSENVNGDWSGFTGTLNYNTASKVVNFFAPASLDLSHAAVNFANTGNLSNSTFRTNSTGTTKFGSLAGFGYLWVNGATEIGNLGTNTTFSGVISQAGSITKVGTGTLTLSGANTYTGATTVNVGTLALGAANLIADSSALVLGGGTFATGGFGETMNTLTINASSVIDFGAGTSALVFADSSAISWTGTLTLANFDIGTDTLKFGTTNTALTGSQLSAISLSGYTASLDGSGFVTFTAVPEPHEFAVAIAALLGVMVVIRRRKQLA